MCIRDRSHSFLGGSASDKIIHFTMAYRILHAFGAIPPRMEAELQAFRRAVSRFNESEAMPRGILYAIDDNIRRSTYFIWIRGADELWTSRSQRLIGARE